MTCENCIHERVCSVWEGFRTTVDDFPDILLTPEEEGKARPFFEAEPEAFLKDLQKLLARYCQYYEVDNV